MATKTQRIFQELRRRRLPPLPTVRDLVKIYQLSAIKQLSQNFLLDFKLTSKIAKTAGNVSDSFVCEVGPGPGGITRSLLERNPKKIILIEKDKRFESSLKLLEDTCPGKINIYWGDVMSFEMSQLFPEEMRTPWDGSLPKISIVGNLPFNISTPLISRWLSDISERKNAWSYGRVPMTLTFQKEVAERLTAKAGNEQRSRLSIMAQYLTECSMKFTIKGSAFVPKPEVDAGVVRFIPRVEPLIQQPYPLVKKLVRQAFCMRPKYCCRPLSTLFPQMVRGTFTKMLFDISFVLPNTRTYHLTIEDFQRLCDAYAEIIEKYPEIGEYEYRAAKSDLNWEEMNASKYEPLRDADPKLGMAARIKPLDVISGDLAMDCSQEMMLEKTNLDEYL